MWHWTANLWALCFFSQQTSLTQTCVSRSISRELDRTICLQPFSKLTLHHTLAQAQAIIRRNCVRQSQLISIIYQQPPWYDLKSMIFFYGMCFRNKSVTRAWTNMHRKHPLQGDVIFSGWGQSFGLEHVFIMISAGHNTIWKPGVFFNGCFLWHVAKWSLSRDAPPNVDLKNIRSRGRDVVFSGVGAELWILEMFFNPLSVTAAFGREQGMWCLTAGSRFSWNTH